MAEQLTAMERHQKKLQSIVDRMREMQRCPDRIRLAYMVGLLSDQLEKAAYDYLNDAAMETAIHYIKMREKAKNDRA